MNFLGVHSAKDYETKSNHSHLHCLAKLLKTHLIGYWQHPGPPFMGGAFFQYLYLVKSKPVSPLLYLTYLRGFSDRL